MPTDPSPSLTRRAALKAAAVAAVTTLAAPSPLPAADPPRRGPGSPATPVGTRSRHVRAARGGGGGVSTTPLQDLVGTITPSDLHYEVHHAGIPDIDPTAHRLVIHGLVSRPLEFTVEDLRRFPSRSAIHFLECGGNYPIRPPADATPQTMAGLTSQSEWTGVPLAVLLREAGVQASGRWILAEGADGAGLARSCPIRKAWDDALVAYGQNGESLRPSQGFPVRLLLPGYEGNMSVKWLTRLEVTDRPVMTRWETSRYSEWRSTGTIRRFSFVIEPRSIITSPAPPARLARGFNEVRGIAWSGRGRIVRVEVTVDGGATWREAALEGPVLSKAHTRFRLPWRWNGGSATLASRAFDETGRRQPTVAELLADQGPQAPYHLNPIVQWRVHPDGQMAIDADPWP